jgi:hypothetical protein
MRSTIRRLLSKVPRPRARRALLITCLSVLTLPAAWLGACSFSDRGDAGLRAVGVEDVLLGEESVIVLRERDGAHRQLHIAIGPYEAQSIALAMHDLELPRPNSHDLIKRLMSAIEVRISRVVITEMRESVYFAELELEVGGRRLPVDARPSDAIAVALRTKTPIFAADDLLQSRTGSALEIRSRAQSRSPDLRVH